MKVVMTREEVASACANHLIKKGLLPEDTEKVNVILNYNIWKQTWELSLETSDEAPE